MARLWNRVYRGDTYFEVGGRCYYEGVPHRIIDRLGDFHLVIVPEDRVFLAKLQYRLYRSLKLFVKALKELLEIWHVPPRKGGNNGHLLRVG